MTNPSPIMPLARDMGQCLERMIGLQMDAYPRDWSASDKREVAMKHLGLDQPNYEGRML